MRLVLRLLSHAVVVVSGARGVACVATPDRERKRQRERARESQRERGRERAREREAEREAGGSHCNRHTHTLNSAFKDACGKI